jgi:hypothetical protein
LYGNCLIWNEVVSFSRHIFKSGAASDRDGQNQAVQLYTPAAVFNPRSERLRGTAFEQQSRINALEK